MRTILAFASLTIAALLATGCDSGGSGGTTHAYNSYHNEWDTTESGNRYDYQYRDARPAGGQMDSNYGNGWNRE